jgi:hypothetical protein
MPKGVRKDGPKTMCQKGKHPFTAANTIYEPSGVRRCFMCREASKLARLRRFHNPHPTDTGMCEAGLHLWIPENLVSHGREGTFRCKPCAQAAQRKFYEGKHYVSCIVGGCPRATYRRDDSNYVCRNHRANPPSWFEKLGLIIQGTQLIKQTA